METRVCVYSLGSYKVVLDAPIYHYYGQNSCM